MASTATLVGEIAGEARRTCNGQRAADLNCQIFHENDSCLHSNARRTAAAAAAAAALLEGAASSWRSGSVRRKCRSDWRWRAYILLLASLRLQEPHQYWTCNRQHSSISPNHTQIK